MRRRDALQLFLASAASVALPTVLNAASFLRTEWTSTTPDGKRNRASFIKGWTAIKNRPGNPSAPWEDPYSMAYFVGFHNELAVHGSYHFGPWHAGFLWWFEQVIRVLSADPQFSLPYLDFSKMSGRILPSEFRTKTSALYHPTRASSINNGGAYPLSAVQWQNSVQVVPYTTTDGSPSLGGIAGPPLRETGAIQGSLQAQPHGPIHNATGGDMVDLAVAPRDPLFYLLHGWIQMLIRFWRSRGGEYPSTDAFLYQMFAFRDANGNSVQKPVSQILGEDFAQKYEAWPTLPAAPAARMSLMMAKSAVILQPAEVLATVNGLALPSNKTTVQVKLTHAARSGRVLLTLSGITCNGSGAFEELYVDLPSGVTPKADGPYFAGSIAPVRHGDICGAGGTSQVFDITNQVGSATVLNLTFVPQLPFKQTTAIGNIRTLEVRG